MSIISWYNLSQNLFEQILEGEQITEGAFLKMHNLVVIKSTIIDVKEKFYYIFSYSEVNCVW